MIARHPTRGTVHAVHPRTETTTRPVTVCGYPVAERGLLLADAPVWEATCAVCARRVARGLAERREH